MSIPKHQRSERPLYEFGHRFGHYKVIKRIGQGGYGDIYLVKKNHVPEFYALKVEFTNARKQALKKEISFIENLQGSDYFPLEIEFQDKEYYRMLVMELLGPSVSVLRRYCENRHFSLGTTLKISKKMLNTLEEFHKRGFIHRDIKPSNFLLKPRQEDIFCLIDYGLCKKYIDKDTGSLIPQADNPGFKGTFKYASVGTMRGHDQSRKDDLISWFYSMYEMYVGRLPWRELKDKEPTIKMKRHFTEEDEYLNLPMSLQSIFEYINSLTFYEEPDYDMIRTKIDDTFNEANIDPKDIEDYKLIPLDKVRKISFFPLKDNIGPDGKVINFEIRDIVDLQKIMKERQEKIDAEKAAQSKTESKRRSEYQTSITCNLI